MNPLKWLKSSETVKLHLSKYDVIKELNQHNGFLRIQSFLPEEVAEWIASQVRNLDQSRWDIRSDNAVGNDDSVAHRFEVASSFRGLGASNDAIELGTNVLRQLLPEKRAVFNAARYSGGDHIKNHDDHAYVKQDGILCSRDVAAVYYLTKDWKKEYGGLFVDNGDNGKEYLPEFNSLILFTVPRFHEVTALRTDLKRYSLFGWFLCEGDLYNFTKIENQTKKKTRKRKGKRKRR